MQHGGSENDYITITNTGSFPIDYVEYNNTAYIITEMDAGRTLDKVSCSTADTLRLFRLLTNIIGQYHKRGLLHLDIKPQNIEVCDMPKPGLRLVLLDTDSVISKTRLGTDCPVKCTKDYSAPELLRGNYELIDERADIYSVGVCLFSRLMGRMPETYDSSFYADWKKSEFEDNSLTDEAADLIKIIFKKTIADNPDSRYADMAALSEELKRAEQIIVFRDLETELKI